MQMHKFILAFASDSLISSRELESKDSCFHPMPFYLNAQDLVISQLNCFITIQLIWIIIQLILKGGCVIA